MSGDSFRVRDCKAGRHKRSSSKATAGISGKYFSGISSSKLLANLVIITGGILRGSSSNFSERGVMRYMTGK